MGRDSRDRWGPGATLGIELEVYESPPMCAHTLCSLLVTYAVWI